MVLHPYQQLDIDERVKRVIRATPLFDGHNDLPQQPRCLYKGKIHNNPKFDLRNGFQRGMTDIPRLREGLHNTKRKPIFKGLSIVRSRRSTILVCLCTMSAISREFFNS